MLVRPSILIADDDRLLRESLSEALAEVLADWRRAGGSIRQVGSGATAIDAMLHERCDLLLSDVDMPDMTGFQLLSWITAHPRPFPAPSPKVVLMSARADDRLGEAARAAGAVTLLAKPVEIRRIAGLVHQLFPD